MSTSLSLSDTSHAGYGVDEPPSGQVHQGLPTPLAVTASKWTIPTWTNGRSPPKTPGSVHPMATNFGSQRHKEDSLRQKGKTQSMEARFNINDRERPNAWTPRQPYSHPKNDDRRTHAPDERRQVLNCSEGTLQPRLSPVLPHQIATDSARPKGKAKKEEVIRRRPHDTDDTPPAPRIKPQKGS